MSVSVDRVCPSMCVFRVGGCGGGCGGGGGVLGADVMPMSCSNYPIFYSLFYCRKRKRPSLPELWRIGSF